MVKNSFSPSDTSSQLLSTTTGLVPTKMEKISPYFWLRFKNDMEVKVEAEMEGGPGEVPDVEPGEGAEPRDAGRAGGEVGGPDGGLDAEDDEDGQQGHHHRPHPDLQHRQFLVPEVF